MGKYAGVIATVYGQAMMTESMSTQQALIFTKMKLGDGALAENESSVEFTDLKHSVLELSINTISNQGNKTCQLIATVDNTNVDTGFFAREVGIFAKVGDSGEEQLYAYTNAGNYADYVPDKNSTLDEKRISVNLAIGNASTVTAIIGSAQYATLENLNTAITTHDTNSEAHSNLLRVTSMTNTDDGLTYTTQDNKTHSLNLWDKLKASITGATGLTNGDKHTIREQLEGMASQIKAITGKSNWWDKPDNSLAALIPSITAFESYDVDDPNAWWGKFRGAPGLIIQGGRTSIKNGNKMEQAYPVAYAKMALTIAVTYAGGTSFGDELGTDYGKSTFSLYVKNGTTSTYTFTWLSAGI